MTIDYLDPVSVLRSLPKDMPIRDCVFHLHQNRTDQMPYPDECATFLEELQQYQLRYICELGMAQGQMTCLLARIARDDAIVVGVDWSAGLASPEFAMSARAQQQLIPITADIHEADTVVAVQEALGGHPLDLLYIDADHTEKSTRLEVEMYRKLVRPSGIIGFHDVTQPDSAPREIWKELSKPNRTAKWFFPDRSGYGHAMVVME